MQKRRKTTIGETINVETLVDSEVGVSSVRSTFGITMSYRDAKAFAATSPKALVITGVLEMLSEPRMQSTRGGGSPSSFPFEMGAPTV
ncbi:hypothetical protein V6N13_042776 [Hibiscus sabdariffa]|uniref:Uncharacterized protein n=1 Tax=Hibiscus sabdariffa TaxID=183260 RepID=A0ABR2G3N4_9ROSI